MSVYFFVIVLIFIYPMVFSFVHDAQKRSDKILQFSMLTIFVLMALKAPSVGRDIAGYKRIYDLMALQPWMNFDISWMEWGYEFLMMVFTHIFRAPFQTFMACIYAFVYLSYYSFFKRYSEDCVTSILLYICFTFLTFDMSAIRTMLGVAICLYAVPYAEKHGFSNFFLFSLITLAAAQIHKSAYIFFAIYLVIKVQVTKKTVFLYIGVPLVLFALKNQIYGIINMYFKSVQESSISLGGNLLVYIFSILMTVFVWVEIKKNVHSTKYFQGANKTDIEGYDSVEFFSNSNLAVRMTYVGVILQLFGAGTVLTRMAQYAQFFILVLIPNSVARLNGRSRVIVKMILYGLAIAYFAKFSLFANALDIVPYKFFWSRI